MRASTRAKLEVLFMEWIGTEKEEDVDNIPAEDMIVALLIEALDKIEQKADYDHGHTLS